VFLDDRGTQPQTNTRPLKFFCHKERIENSRDILFGDTNPIVGNGHPRRLFTNVSRSFRSAKVELFSNLLIRKSRSENISLRLRR
jgi:hypothetical protein